MMDVLEVMRTERRCVIRNSIGGCDRDCAKCDLLLPTNDVIAGYDKVIMMIKNLRMMAGQQVEEDGD